MNFTEQQVNEFNAGYELACRKMKGLSLMEEYRPRSMNFLERIRAKGAIKAFQKALQIYPDHWQSLFFLGKIYQRMKDHEKSLYYFESALRVEQDNHNIPQEAALAAMHLNQIEKAIMYSAESVKRKPGDPALMGNHAMNLLIAGQDHEALGTINAALAINGTDSINLRIYQKISGVIAGSEDRPTFSASIL
ncbi:hypothetical protein MKQ68_11185 [Chitinophaga horti]|uniref:Tetratricopeptide repeat protein n=1 Tax=Chitinophaga horti TaxID=2920382 RepID=A0ABY6JBJ8_9BACT|nr:hypothetical protein [Chitinophaga horti]UYQ95666.1 hypothetical protein MKQ68_11185 [Chitinophaga horti]